MLIMNVDDFLLWFLNNYLLVFFICFCIGSFLAFIILLFLNGRKKHEIK